MTKIPATMTSIGLKFLTQLAHEKNDGVFLEIGPLFGSSTDAISRGRKNAEDNIHTIDTFEAAPWVKRRLGIDLSREAFDKHTSHISNLVVHQGYAPDIVHDSWSENIGFYFDDATHGDPGWSNNFNFFKDFFDDAAIICGDDFAGGWPDIVKNVYRITEEWNVQLYIIGRVFAFTKVDDMRIENAIDILFPKLSKVHTHTFRENEQKMNKSACWSWGIHRNEPIEHIAIDSPGKYIKVSTYKNGDLMSSSESSTDEHVTLLGCDAIKFTGSKRKKFQLCLSDEKGRTANTKAISFGEKFDIPEGNYIVSLRLE